MEYGIRIRIEQQVVRSKAKLGSYLPNELATYGWMDGWMDGSKPEMDVSMYTGWQADFLSFFLIHPSIHTSLN